ncbi:hypothetical protein BVX99_00985 [bacterium F16]|nr:hypothetical protein BVX99_00985 [bacterium F16]
MSYLRNIRIAKKTKQTIILSPFSLIELLVVTGVIAILAGMMMPALAKAKSKAVEAKMISNMKQLNVANIMYYDADNPNQYLWNTKTGGGAIGVDYSLLTPHGFQSSMMEDSFRRVSIATDTVFTTLSLSLDATSFHSSGKGLLYFNFSSKDSGNLDIMTLSTFNTKFGYVVPSDTQYVVVGVGTNEQLDPGQPENDFVVIKRESNANNERWPQN